MIVGLVLNAVAFVVGCASIDEARAFAAPANSPSPGNIPAQAPKLLRTLVGEYGVAGELVTVFEAGGRLHAKGPNLDDVVLREHGALEFTTAGTGADTAVFAFHLDAAGNCIAVSVDGTHWPRGTVWPRRDVGAEAVAAIRSGLTADPATLRAAALAAQPPAEPPPKRPMDLVALSSIDPDIKFDIRYASSNNFMGFPLYEQPDAFLQRPAAQALGRVVKRLRAKGYGVLVYDAYRPWFVTRMFWDATPPESRVFVADPAKGSRHNRGCAVDLTLYALRTGQPEEMTSRYDEFSRRAYPDYIGGTSRERWLRDLLRREMETAGFTVYPEEWWHFDYNGWQDYGIGNATFAELRKSADGREDPQVPPYQLTATVQDLMEGLIDPSADALWDSVAYIASASGVEDRQPRTAGQWQAVRTSAVNLIEAANLLRMPGRVVAHDPPDNPPSPGPGELSHADIQKRIDATHVGFVQFSRVLQAAGLQALEAIDARNAQGLMDSGAIIDAACEACHMTYWYPNQRRP